MYCKETPLPGQHLFFHIFIEPMAEMIASGSRKDFPLG
jgi:hypothetical protein